MVDIPWSNLIMVALTAIVMWFMGWVRTFMAKRVAVSSPVERKVKKLCVIVRKQGAYMDALADRTSFLVQSTLLLANAVKIGDQQEVDKCVSMIQMEENQWMAYLTSQAHSENMEEDETDADNK